ncbi:unnamed protein product, partial [Medioppia subpectinata]
SAKKSTICYIITIVILLALTIGFFAAYIIEKNREEQSVGTSPTAPSVPPTAPTPPPDIELLLPKTVRPKHYDLTVEPNHETNVFTGRVTVEIEVIDATDVIKIHANELTVSGAKVVDKSGADLKISSTSEDTKKQFYIIQLEQPLSKEATYQLSLSFSGSLIGKIIGFYKSSYTNKDNQIRYFSATKFEPTYARQAFPCFDEPNLKATYSISIIHDKELNAISNGEQIERKEENDGRVRTVFSKTVPMSTYLVAYVISDFKYTKDTTKRGTDVRVFARPDEIEKTRYALSTTITILEYYETYFEIDYPMEKSNDRSVPDEIEKTRYALSTTITILEYYETYFEIDYPMEKLVRDNILTHVLLKIPDMVALPVFVSGAMENWGIITFRETNLLYSADQSSASEQKSVAGVIGHELAHMWFGNLVTMEWWDDLWLNEGFASYVEYRGKDASHPEWQNQQFFLNDDMHGVMRTDTLDTSHPIIQEVTNPDQITEIFDAISYNKGSAVLRMLEYAIGSDVFRSGVVEYLKKNSYGNAETKDLWAAIQTIVDKKPGTVPNVNDFMDRWTRVKGYPVVTVTRTSAEEITFSQTTFLLNAGDNQNNVISNNRDSTLWDIYITYRSADQTGSHLLKKQEESIKLNAKIPLTSWIKLNDEQYGYFIVNYGETGWKLLTDLLKTNREELSPVNRANLIFDASMLAESGLLSYKTFMDLISYVKDEDNLIPWMAANSAIARLNDKLSSSDGGLTVKEFKKQMTDSMYASLGWQSNARSSESFQQKLLRNYIISLACSSGNQDCLQEANNQFKQFLTTGQPIGADIRANAYKYGIQVNTNDNEWNQVLDLWLTEVSSAEKSKLLTALTSVDDSQLLSKLITKSEDAVIVNDQDFFTFQQSIAANSLTGRQLVWNYMRQNWHKLVDRFKINDRRLGSYITSVTNNFNTETQLNELKAFFEANPESGATENARKQALERVQNNIKWSTTHEESVVQWLNTNSPSVNPWLNWRLDPQVVPQAYKVHWTIDLSADTFSGTVRIEVNVKKPIKQFVLHSKGLTITESKAYLGDINSADEKPLNEKSEPIVYTDNDFYVILTDTTIRADIYHLYLEFNGKLSTGLNGLYKSVYTDSTGTSKSLATTQFQSTYARQALPCFDEPQFKATFDITITHSAQYNVISNMPVRESVIADGGLKVTKFDPSVKMVTYLVALVVSDFECFVSPSDKRVRVCGAPGNKPKLDYALDKTPAILKFYESEYFQIPYPLPKLDNIAVPDFSAGAMENWGLVTYREVYLFYDETESTTKSQMQVCMIIAHELAHMLRSDLRYAYNE